MKILKYSPSLSEHLIEVRDVNYMHYDMVIFERLCFQGAVKKEGQGSLCRLECEGKRKAKPWILE